MSGLCWQSLILIILQAMREKAEAIKAANMRIFVRRGGPNYQAGLALMRKLGEELGIFIDVYGPDSSMTGICKLAIDHVRSYDTKSDSKIQMESTAVAVKA